MNRRDVILLEALTALAAEESRELWVRLSAMRVLMSYADSTLRPRAVGRWADSEWSIWSIGSIMHPYSTLPEDSLPADARDRVARVFYTIAHEDPNPLMRRQAEVLSRELERHRWPERMRRPTIDPRPDRIPH